MHKYTIRQQAALSDIIFNLYDDEFFTVKDLQGLLKDLGFELTKSEIYDEITARR